MTPEIMHNVVCPRCGKTFYATACMACDGKSYHRYFLVIKRICKSCKGAGKEYYCPDLMSHHDDDDRERRWRMVEEYIRSYGQSAIY